MGELHGPGPRPTDERTSIRPAELGDHGDILRLWRAASRIGHPFLTESDLDRQAAIIARNHLHTAEIWIAERNQGAIGFIAHVGDHIGALFVRPSAHRGGIGRGLLEHLKARRPRLELGVYEANLGARRFYERQGFVVQGRSEQDEEGRALPVLHLAWRGSDAANRAPVVRPSPSGGNAP